MESPNLSANSDQLELNTASRRLPTVQGIAALGLFAAYLLSPLLA